MLTCEEFRQLAERLSKSAGTNAEYAAIINHGHSCVKCARWIASKREKEQELTPEQNRAIQQRMQRLYEDQEAMGAMTDKVEKEAIEELEKPALVAQLDEAISSAEDLIRSDAPLSAIDLFALQIVVLKAVRALVAHMEDLKRERQEIEAAQLRSIIRAQVERLRQQHPQFGDDSLGQGATNPQEE